MENLYSSQERASIAPLLIGPLQHASRVGVAFKGGQGILPRGAVCYLGADGLCAHAGNAQMTATPAAQMYILEADLDTGTDDEKQMSAAVFESGRFNRDALGFADSVTDMAAAEAVLRTQGIALGAIAG